MLSRLLWLAVPLCAAFFLIVVFALCVVVATGALAHDQYGSIKNKRGMPCCGGEGPNADCSPITEADQLQEGRHLTRFWSTIWKDWITVPNEQVVPLELPQDQERGIIGHICAKPRANLQWPPEPSESDPDQKFTVYCAFVKPRSF